MLAPIMAAIVIATRFGLMGYALVCEYCGNTKYGVPKMKNPPKPPNFIDRGRFFRDQRL